MSKMETIFEIIKNHNKALESIAGTFTKQKQNFQDIVEYINRNEKEKKDMLRRIEELENRIKKLEVME